jgi:hypothetical protein
LRGVGTGQDQTNDIVRFRGQESLHDAGADHVIRWGGDIGEAADPVGVVADRTERRQREAG